MPSTWNISVEIQFSICSRNSRRVQTRREEIARFNAIVDLNDFQDFVRGIIFNWIIS